MNELVRFGVSLEHDLLEAFDSWSKRRGYANRSEALRRIIRQQLDQEAIDDPDAPVAGVLSLLYDHHEQDLPGRLTAIQHAEHATMLATMHVHLDLHNCLEIMALRGSSGHVRPLAEKLEATRGVRQGHLCVLPVESCNTHQS